MMFIIIGARLGVIATVQSTKAGLRGQAVGGLQTSPNGDQFQLDVSPYISS